MELKRYTATRDGFVLGQFRRAGDVVEASPRQARYLTLPLGDDLTEGRPRSRRRAAPASSEPPSAAARPTPASPPKARSGKGKPRKGGERDAEGGGTE